MELVIGEDFLKEEVRCGFKVTERMKRAWAAELKILTEIDALCKKYNITYFAEVGTLLGAVRHHGFIPWDDDIDLAMKRDDYMRFLSVAHELPADYRIKSMYHDVTGTFCQFHAVVENFVGEKLEWDEKRNEKFFGCPFICAIDIFPLDYIPRDPGARQMKKLLYNLAYVLAGKFDTEGNTPEFMDSVAVLEAQCGGSFDHSVSLRPQLYQLTDRIAAMTPAEEADELDYFPKMVTGGDTGFRRKEWYESTFVFPFEMVEIPIPNGADDALKNHYGENYGTFIKGTSAHDYPFYKSQEELFSLQGFLEPETHEV